MDKLFVKYLSNTIIFQTVMLEKINLAILLAKERIKM